MLDNIISFYITLTPVIIGGILNSAFSKSSLFPWLNKPIDAGRLFIDRRRIFGANKTYKGFFGYVVIIAAISIIWGWVIVNSPYLTQHNFFYRHNSDAFAFNVAVGALLGFVWALSELPNSFIKRRFDVAQSKDVENIWSKTAFVLIDQADSVFGVTLVIALFNPLSLGWYLAFVALGAGTHLVINYLLYLTKLRSQPV